MRTAHVTRTLPGRWPRPSRVGPGVRTDLELSDWYVARATDEDPENAVASHREALDLVTGRPFSYPNTARCSFAWVDVEHHATTWEFKVAGVAKAYAELCLDLGYRDDALDVLHDLLLAMPLNSALVKALMRTHLAAGNRSAAEGVYNSTPRRSILLAAGSRPSSPLCATSPSTAPTTTATTHRRA